MKRVPSITKQTDFDCWLVNFGKATESAMPPAFFNPSLIYHEGNDWLIARRSDNWWDRSIWMNSIWAFKLGERHPMMGLKIGLAGYKGQHFEDPRMSRIRGSLWLSYCTFVAHGQNWYGAHQGLSILHDSFQPDRMFDPIWGGNGGSVLMNDGHEKNWTWFECDGRVYCVYMTEPHQVVEWDDSMTAIARHETSAEPFAEWSLKWGHARGGTPPVLVDNLFWSFFHSSLDGDAPNGKRRYFMGAYAFESKPPFAVKSVSKVPVLTGSEDDPWYPTLPLVVFPCGSIFRNNEWTVSLGVNDLASAIIKIPHEAIQAQTETGNHPVAFTERNIGFSEKHCRMEKRHRSRRIRRRKPRQARVAGNPDHPAGQQPAPCADSTSQCNG